MNKDRMRAMAERIKDRRDALGYTQEQFAETIKLSASSYTKIENAFQKPGFDTLINISEALDISLDYLVYGKDTSIPSKPDESDLARAAMNYADPEELEHVKKFLELVIKVKRR